MKTTRKKIIHDKIFTKRDVKNLWSKIKSEYEGSREENKYSSLVMNSSLVMKINCNDGISYESETNDLIQDGDIIDIKKCSTISIEYIDYKLGRRINLDLSRGNEHYGNDLIVQGDNDWVAGTFGTLNDIIDSVKPQEHWFIKYQRLILF